MSTFLEDARVLSKKETALIATFYTLSFITSIIVPMTLSAVLGMNMTKSFCDKHSDICGEYSDSGQETTFLGSLKSDTYFGVAVMSLSAGLAVSVLLVGLIMMPKAIMKCCKEDQEVGSTESSPLLSSSNHRCCQLFSKFRKNVLPTKFDLYQLLITASTLIAGCAFAVWSIADSVSRDICSSELSYGTCGDYFSGASPEQRDQLAKFSDKVYNSMMSIGIMLGIITALSVAVGTMAVGTCIKHRMSRKIDNRINEIETEQLGVDHNF